MQVLASHNVPGRDTNWLWICIPQCFQIIVLRNMLRINLCLIQYDTLCNSLFHYKPDRQCHKGKSLLLRNLHKKLTSLKSFLACGPFINQPAKWRQICLCNSQTFGNEELRTFKPWGRRNTLKLIIKKLLSLSDEI